MATTKKQESVQNLTDKLSKAKAWVLADYTGITHKQLEDLRKILKKIDGEITVVKNRLFKKALTDQKKEFDETHLQGATAALFAYKDEVSPIKELVNFGKVKYGFLGNNPLNAQEITRFASLPTREQLLAQLVGQLQAPIYGLHNALSWNLKKLVWTLNNIKDGKK